MLTQTYLSTSMSYLDEESPGQHSHITMLRDLHPLAEMPRLIFDSDMLLGV